MHRKRSTSNTEYHREASDPYILHLSHHCYDWKLREKFSTSTQKGPRDGLGLIRQKTPILAIWFVKMA